jgi:hypothetical protein
MRARQCAAVLLLCASSGASAADRWTTRDTVLELSLVSVTLVDTMQTIHFLHEGHEEANVILGERPSVGKLLLYDAVALGLHFSVALLLPQPYRTVWQTVWVGVEIVQIGSNVRTVGNFHVTLPWNW